VALALRNAAIANETCHWSAMNEWHWHFEMPPLPTRPVIGGFHKKMCGAVLGWKLHCSTLLWREKNTKTIEQMPEKFLMLIRLWLCRPFV
jgi:hypothetical protein